MLIESPALGLRRTDQNDIPFVHAVESSPDNRPFIKQWPPERHLATCRTPGEAHLCIVKPGGDPVGYVILSDLESPNASVQLRRIAVRDKGRGYGREAVRLIKRFAFERAGAHRLWLEVRDHNVRAKLLYDSEGFVTEGLIRDSICNGERYESVYLMSMLRSEYHAWQAGSMQSDRTPGVPLHPEARGRSLYLNRAEVESICRELDGVSLIEEVFRLHGRGMTVLPNESCLIWNEPGGGTARSLNMPAYVGGAFQRAGTKIINANIANPVRGLPRAAGLTLLFDTASARIQCMMEGASISALRTASASLLAISRLGTPPVRTLAIVGAGPIGAAHARLAQNVLPALERLLLYDLDTQTAAHLADSLRPQFPQSISVELAGSSEAASRAADALITATTVTKSYIPFEWLKRGTTVVNVSLDDFAADVFLNANLLFVDDWNLVREDPRRLLGKLYRQHLICGPTDSPTPGQRRVDGTLADLVLGRHPGRQSPDQTIVVNPFGLAIEDVAFAARIYEIAVERGVGIYLPT